MSEATRFERVEMEIDERLGPEFRAQILSEGLTVRQQRHVAAVARTAFVLGLVDATTSGPEDVHSWLVSLGYGPNFDPGAQP